MVDALNCHKPSERVMACQRLRHKQCCQSADIHFPEEMRVIIPLTSAYDLERHPGFRGFECDRLLFFPWCWVV